MLCSYHETENLRYHTLKGPSQMKVQMVPTATMEQLIKPQVNIKNLLSDFSPVNIAVLAVFATGFNSMFCFYT